MSEDLKKEFEVKSECPPPSLLLSLTLSVLVDSNTPESSMSVSKDRYGCPRLRATKNWRFSFYHFFAEADGAVSI